MVKLTSFLPHQTLLAAFCLLLSVCEIPSAQGQDKQDKIDFGSQVRPILSDRCFHCHGPDAQNQDSAYRMDSEEALMEYIERGDSAASHLYERITAEDGSELMPPPSSNRSLSEDEKNIIKQWIDQGALYAGHWAFEVPTRPQVPTLDAADAANWDAETIDAWSKNPIDAFVAERLIAEKLQPAKPSDLATRIRRVSLTLAGVLPSQMAVDQQVSDPSTDVYLNTVNRVLQSMDYAERQALRWLDAARYADTDGYQNDNERRNWPWRDWVIKAYHENMPFDQFVVEQLAGDMIKDASFSQRLATAFNRNHRQNAEGGALAEEFLVENVIDRVETTSTVFLGLTFGCSRCHDHKYDPLSQEEFYRMYGYFNNIGERGIGKGIDANPTMTAASPLRNWDQKFLDQVLKAQNELDQASGAYKKRLAEWSKEMTALVAKVEQAGLNKDPETAKKAKEAKETEKAKEAEKAKKAKAEDAVKVDKVTATTDVVKINDEEQKRFDKLSDDIKKILRKPAKSREGPDKNKLDRFFATLDPEQSKLLAAVKKTSNQFKKRGGDYVQVMTMAERSGDPAPIYLLGRGQYTEPVKDNPLQRGVPEVLLGDNLSQPADRYEFAQWMVSKDNPLTARVTVNRIWRDHFGVGLVKTTDDFGVQGEAPSHPKLLDWLAIEFIESGWDVKAMHRLIVTSQAYQQSSKMDEKSFEMDPENRLLARGPRYRVDGFTIRDIALQAAGLLNTEIGGPPVKPYQPEGLWQVVAPSANSRYRVDKGKRLYRKSMYSFWKRAVNPPRQTIFDAGGREVCSVQVRRTNTPLQALVLMNDQTFVEAARVLADDVLSQGLKTDREKLELVFRRAIGRAVDSSTLATLTEGLSAFRDHYRQQTGEADRLLEVGKFPANKKLDVVEQAALTMIAHVVMNLDEFLTVE